jgi:hypothetical protein
MEVGCGEHPTTNLEHPTSNRNNEVTKGKRGTNGVMEQWSNEGKDCWIGGGVE